MFEQAISAMASVVVDPYLLGLIFATTILGVIIGVLPGLGATTGAALLLPFTLTMDPVHAIAVLATILCFCHIRRFNYGNFDQYSWHFCSSSYYF